MRQIPRFAIAPLAVAALWMISLAGCGGGGNSNPPLQQSPALEMLVGSAGNGRILRFDADTGEYLGVFAQGGNLQSPNGMAVLSDGRVAVGDFTTHQVLLFDSVGNQVSILGTMDGTPYGMVATDDGGFLLSIFDSGTSGKVVRWSPASGFTTFAEGGSLKGPDGLVIRDGNVFVSSQKSASILKYNLATGSYLGVLTSGGRLGLSPAAGPSGLAAGFGTSLYVAQHDNDPTVTKGGNVLEFSFDTGKIRNLLVDSTKDSLSGPVGIVFAPRGNRVANLPDHLLVASAATHEVRAYDVSGKFLGALATGNGLNTPIYLALRTRR